MKKRLGVVVFATGVLAFSTSSAQSPPVFRDSLRDAFADVNGVHLHYRIGGHGPVLVLLHGLTHSAAWWESLAPQLLQDHTVIVPDMRGHGLSTNPSNVFRHPDVATDILELLDQLGIREFSGIGHSSGAGVFLHMAARAPDRVNSMMIIGLGHRVTDTTRAQWRRYPALSTLPQSTQHYWVRIHPGGTPQVERLLGYLRHVADSAQDINIPRDMLAHIKARTLIVFGDRDDHPVEIATELYRILPNAQLWIVPNTGHFPFWTEFGGNPSAAAEFPRVVKSFFAVPTPSSKGT